MPSRAPALAVLAALLAYAAACGASSKSVRQAREAAMSGATVVTCEPESRTPLPGTQAVFIDNFWNEQWAGSRPRKQCLLQRTRPDGSIQHGWSWEWPRYKPWDSYAAPEALIGWKAWDGGASTSPDLPRRIDMMRSLEVDFATEIAADETYNLNTTMWITTTDGATAEPRVADIRNEIMVWFANPARLGGGITYDGKVTLGGIAFDVWHLPNTPDRSGKFQQTWTMIIYAARTNRYAATFDLKLVLDDCVAKKLVDPSHAVGGVELITEVFGGRGVLWLDRFSVKVR